MTDTDSDNLKQRETRLTRRYDQYFAGQPRHSRDPSLLDEMLTEARAIAAAARRAGSTDAASIGQNAMQLAALYEKEAKQIREIQSATTGVFLSHEYRSWARIVFQRYQRNFAGQSRVTRDGGLLVSMMAELERLDQALERIEGRDADDAVLAETRESIASNLQLYRDELGRIVDTRRAGDEAEQADALAGAANVQFAQYKAHYAGKKRISRSLKRLELIIDELADIRSSMAELEERGLALESNVSNIATVDARLAFYRDERLAIQEARGRASFDELVNELGSAANLVFEAYRKEFAGQQRGTRDRQRLVALTEELYDLAQEMERLDRVRDNDDNQHNLAVVLDQLRMYHREFVEIGKVQKRS